jgi:hypothetical protein
MVHLPHMYGESGPFGISVSAVFTETGLLLLRGKFRGQPIHEGKMPVLPVPRKPVNSPS